MAGNTTEERVAREAVDTLVKEDGVERKRAERAVAFILENADVKATDGLQIYRATRRHLRLSLPPPPDDEDDGRPTLEILKGKPQRRGTRKDTPAAKKDRAK